MVRVLYIWGNEGGRHEPMGSGLRGASPGIDTGSIRTTEEEALLFHSSGRPGKLSIAPTKPLTTQRDLSLAYSPGAASPVGTSIAAGTGLAALSSDPGAFTAR